MAQSSKKRMLRLSAGFQIAGCLLLAIALQTGCGSASDTAADADIAADAPVTDADVSVPTANTTPLLNNFRVEDGQPARVYFDSSSAIDTMTTVGFTINGKTISDLIVQTGLTTGHYFTVGSAFTFWDNNTIRLGEITDEVDRQAVLHNFSMEHIVNNIAEPPAATDRYVAANAEVGAGDGSQGAPWNIQDLAAVDFLSPGTTVWIKAGEYSASGTTWNAALYSRSSGTTNSPIKFIGYKTTPGDITTKFIDDFTYTTHAAAKTYFDSTQYPVLRGTFAQGQRGIRNPGKFVIHRNLAITETDTGAGNLGDDQLYENIIMGVLKIAGGQGGQGFQAGVFSRIRIKEVVSFDANTTCISVGGNSILVDNCRAYAGNHPNASTDYGVGIANGRNAIIKDCKVQEFEGNYLGHGVGIKATEAYENSNGHTSYNLIVGNDTKMLDQSENLYVRRKSAHHNVVKRNTANFTYNGARVGNGSYLNLFEENIVTNCQVAFAVSGNGESDPWVVPSAGSSIQSRDNIVRNNVFTNVDTLFAVNVKGDHGEPDNNVFLNTGNKMYNNTITGIRGNIIRTTLAADNGQTGWSYDFSGSEFRNNLFLIGQSNNDSFYYNNLADESSFTWDYNNWTDKPANWTLPGSNTTQLDPQLDASYVPANPATLVAPKLFGVEYDKNRSEREATTTIGAVKLVSE